MKKFKLAWVTPSTSKTSVSEFSASVVKGLNDFLTVDLLSFDDHYSEAFLNLPNSKKFVNDLEVSWYKKYEFVVYNFGNNWENHGEIIKMAGRIPGIIILHDASMHHVLAYYACEKYKNRNLYANFMIGEYGRAGSSVVIDSEIQASSPKYGPWDHDCGPDFGFLDFFCRGSLGYIVHSKYTLSKFNEIDAPVHITRLPGDEKGIWNKSEIDLWRKKFLNKNTINFCVMGYLNPQKNIDKAIDYIYYINDFGVDCTLLILGGDKSGFHEKMQTYAKSRGLGHKVFFKINLDRKSFNEAKKNADVYLSFRYPNYEGCSAAAFEAMQTGRPLVTYKSGAFSEFDEGSVYFVDEIDDLKKSALSIAERLKFNKNEMLKVGNNGREYSLSIDSNKYALDFSKFIEAIPRSSYERRYLPEISLHESDYLLNSPKYVFFDESDSGQLGTVCALQEFSDLFDNEFVIDVLKRIYKKNPLRYWDVICLIKKINSGEEIDAEFECFKSDVDFFYDVISVLQTIKSDSALKIFLSSINVSQSNYLILRGFHDYESWCRKFESLAIFQ